METPDSNIIAFKPKGPIDETSPLFGREPYKAARCDHKGCTIYLDVSQVRVTCSRCEQVIEAFYVLKNMLDKEYWKARRENASTYQRLYAEEKAENQANKTRKAAYATLYRFGVTPEMYAEEYRRKLLLGELEVKQDYSQTLTFAK